MKKYLERGAAAGLGVVFSLLVLEAGLRVGGKALLPDRDLPQVERKAPGEKRVLCIGDSFVDGDGIGDRTRDSFPAQLQRLFRDEVPGAKVSVINQGRSGENLYQIRVRLENDIDVVQPDLVVLLGGYIQGEQCYGYYRYVGRGNLFFRSLDLCTRSSVLRLARYLQADLQRKKMQRYEQLLTVPPEDAFVTPAGKARAVRCRELAGTGDIGKAIDELKAALAVEPGCLPGWYRLWEIGQGYNDNQETVRQAVEQLSARGFANDKMYWLLSSCYSMHGDERRAVDAMVRGLETGWVTFTPNRCYRSLVQFYRVCREPDLRRRMRTSIFLHFYKDLSAFAVFLNFNDFDASIDDWSRYEIGRVIGLCRERRIPVLLQTYPEERYTEEKRMNALVRGIAVAQGVLLLDQTKLFAGMPRDRFVSSRDGIHCNEFGYARMARNIFELTRGDLAGTAPQLPTRKKG